MGNMTVFVAAISGLTPMLMHRWAEAEETEHGTRAVHIEKRDPRKEAEKVCYRNSEGGIYFPGAAIAPPHERITQAGWCDLLHAAGPVVEPVSRPGCGGAAAGGISGVVRSPEDALRLVDGDNTQT